MTDTKSSSTGTFAFALTVAALGGLVVGWIAREQLLPAPAPAAPQPALSSMLEEPTQAVAPPNAAAIAAAESELVRQYEQINLGFVAQLRRYGERLTEIADIAEAEGATTAAQAMRDFGKETDDVIARFDKVAKQ